MQKRNLKEQIIERMEDLKQKIELEEETPDGKLNYDSLVEIDDALDQILSMWYY